MELNIFEYTDHKAFIRDYYEFHKAKNPKFSYRIFAKKAGFSSSASIPLVVSGKKTMAVDSIRRFAKVIGFSKNESVYFESLVLFNQARDAASKEYYKDILRSLRKEKPGHVIDRKQFAYLSNWYYPVIREMVTLPDFRGDRSWIVERLGRRVSPKQVRDALDDMIKIGLLKRDEEGRLRQVDTAISTGDEISHKAIFMIHHQMIMLAREVLIATRGIGSEITGLTMAISKEQFKEIVAMTRDFQNDVIEYLEKHNAVPDSVAQFNVQLFNVTS